MNVFGTILIEFLFVSSCILFLFKYRSQLGLAPLYIFLGAIQYLQVFSSAYISFQFLETYTIYPVSVIIFSAVLFAVLLIYIKEGVTSARTLILGIIISNFLLTALAGITYIQESVLGMIADDVQKSGFNTGYKYFIVGTIILLFDFVFLVILYQFFITKIKKVSYFFVLFIALTLVLFFDSIVFNVLLRYDDPNLLDALIGHFISKSVAAFAFSVLLYAYLKFIDKEQINVSFIANQNRDVFSIITYRQKYLNLKVEKEQVEKVLTSKLESTLNNSSDGFVSLDTNWCYTYVNNKAGEYLGRDVDYLIGKHIWTEFPEGINQPYYKAYYKAVETQETQVLQEYYEPFDKWFENRIYPSSDGLTIYFTDITEQKKLNLALKEVAIKSKEKKNVIMELSGLVGTDYLNSLEKITTLTAATLDVERVGVWKFNEDRTAIICEKIYDAKKDQFDSGVILERKDNPNYFDAMAKNKTISVEDAVNNDVTKGFANDYLIPVGITSMLDVFIQGEKEIYGVICFEHIGPIRKWSADDEEFATSIANVVSLMVESTERKLTEEKLITSNEALVIANTELEKLRNQLIDENVYLRNEIDLVFNYEEMVYGSEVFSAVLTEVEKVATTNATVLLLGETGTGKELLARAIQNIGNRKHKPLIKVNCAAIPNALIESELFGHVKGSFTGAINDKVGKFELADGGTLFLDEIGELPLDMQPKLLRFLQEGEIEKVGDTRTLKVDVRIIAATNKDLKREVENKQFREDLYFRLNVFPIMVPPLRERTEDIPLLIEHFAEKFSKAYGKEVTYITDRAMLAMKRYKWPGNIRELENVIERAVILSNNNFLVLPDFDTKMQSQERLISASNLTLDDVQREYIIKILDKCNWKIDGESGASARLNIKPSTLRDRMKKLGVVKPK